MELRQDVIKLSIDPQTMHLTVDMLYYKITSADYSREGEMTVKYAACLQHILNASLQHKAESCRIVRSIIETAMREMKDPNTTTMLTEWADDLLSDKLRELEGAPLLTGKVTYSDDDEDTEIELDTINSFPAMQQATQNIQGVTEFAIGDLSGSGEFSN